MSDLNKIRQENFKLMIEEKAGGSTGQLAKKMEWKPSVASAIKHGRNALTDDRILELSKKLQIPYGWFDENRLEKQLPTVVGESKNRGSLSFVGEGFSLEMELKGDNEAENEITRLALRIIEVRSR